MIAYIQGEPVESGSDYVIIAVSGLGYKIFVPQSRIGEIMSRELVTLHTHMVAKEDGVALFGTETAAELAVFRSLVSVSGVGPKLALSVLSAWPVSKLGQIFAAEDVNALTAVPGVGRKTAQRLLLELKDKLQVEDVSVPGSSSSVARDAEAALVALGYRSSQVRPVIQALARQSDDLETIVRTALSQLARGGTA